MTATVVVGTDPNELDVRDSVVVVPGVAAGRRVLRRGAMAVVARPDALPLATGSAATVRADGLFGSAPAAAAPGRVAELVRVGEGGAVVTAAQVEPGPVGPARPIDAPGLAALLPGEPAVEPFHDRICRKDWHRLTATVSGARGSVAAQASAAPVWRRKVSESQ